ncbi:MAG: M23 family metallopeptidase [Methylobacterium sp.]|uniref:murein hydrolase activator EnvC family protein n=1 Tax=unclassified Methylobacterium TaxID=2615210 RepID=UPI0011C74277|nr:MULTISPECIES: M23 family metallopeptidase [unclassified Methylobacterium]MDO9428153.1 M23 family metallopeptidase [Methylobacterium sp.]TXM78236.1 M23 family metallopeptidase [Methylobacterium sp. WL69]
MRVRGTGRGLKTLSRFALIGVIGGGAAACSSDASRLGDPFGNPFASNVASEPAATGSLPDGEIAPAPVVRTSRIQSQALGAPGVAMSPRPMAAAPQAAPVQTSRLASTEPVSGMVSGLNPDAGRAMTTRSVPAAPVPKAIDRVAERKAAEAAALAARKEAEAEKIAEARRALEAGKVAERKAAEAKAADARKLVDAKKLVETRKAEAAKAVADAKKAHPRPGQTVAKADDKPVRKIEIKEAKADAKSEPKVDAAKVKAEASKEAAKDAAKKAAEAEAKLAKLEAAKASKQVADAKAAEAAAKEAAKESAKAPVKVAAVEAPKAEPASTGSVASDASFRWPAKGRVISGYGSSGNEGINISVPEGTAVKAAEDGTVAYAGSDVKGYGKLVLVRHTNGYVSAYAHNGELDVRPGEKVKRGQTIAKSGASGNVTSPQLHFEIRKGATPVDPMPHLASN